MCFLVDKDFPKVHSFIKKLLNEGDKDDEDFVIKRQFDGFYKKEDIRKFTDL